MGVLSLLDSRQLRWDISIYLKYEASGCKFNICHDISTALFGFQSRFLETDLFHVKQIIANHDFLAEKNHFWMIKIWVEDKKGGLWDR